MKNNFISIRFWGDFACFTRQEMKVERVSYPVITPSAARGMLEAIYWEPEMFYLIDSIRVVKRGEWTRFKRNEVQEVISLNNYESWLRAKKEFSPIIAGAGDPKVTSGTPRNTLALFNVEYIITAEVHLTEKGKNQTLDKYLSTIERHARKGKCFHRPSFGCREFIADFDWVDDADEMLKTRLEVTKNDAWTNDCGLMLYDIFSHRSRNVGIPVEASPSFFHAKINNSIMDCNPERISIIQ
jgi:CRISPR-associated protein Cas5d